MSQPSYYYAPHVGGGGNLTSSSHSPDGRAGSADALGGRQPTASAFLVSHDHDRTAELLRLLLNELRWPTHKVSLRLSVPIIAVEECARTGRSSGLLRGQALQWLRHSGEVPPGVPTALISAVIAEGQRGAAERAATAEGGGAGAGLLGGGNSGGIGGGGGKNSTSHSRTASLAGAASFAGGAAVGSGGPSASSALQRLSAAASAPPSMGTALAGYGMGAAFSDYFDGPDAIDGGGVGGGDSVLQNGPYASLDPYTRAQYDHLRRTVGNNFASVLTDPSDPRVLANNYTAVAWDWLGNTFTETFVEGGPAALRSGPVQPEPLSELLQHHPVTRATFQPYLSAVSLLHNANRAEVAKMNEFQNIKSAFHRELERVGREEETLQSMAAGGGGASAADMAPAVEDLPWPEAVPLAYFEPNYSIGALLRTIPARSHVDVWQAPPEPLAAAAAIGPKISSTRPLPPIPSPASAGGGVSPASSAASQSSPQPPKRLQLQLPPSASSSGSGGSSAQSAAVAAADAAVEAEAEAYLSTLTTEMRGSEEQVELCLITHVLSRSEAFFEASKAFGHLRDDSADILSLLSGTREGVMGRGEGVVSQFLNVLRLHRRRTRLQEVMLKLQSIDRFSGALRKLDVAQNDVATAVTIGSLGVLGAASPIPSPTTRRVSPPPLSSSPTNDSSANASSSSGGDVIIGGGDLMLSVSNALAEALRLRFDEASSPDAAFFGQLGCLGTATAALLMSKRSLQEGVGDRAAAALHPRRWASSDWSDVRGYVAAAHRVGALPAVLQQYQRDITDHIWFVVAKVVVAAGSSGRGVISPNSSGIVRGTVVSAGGGPSGRTSPTPHQQQQQQQQQQPAAVSTSAEAVRAAASNPNARRAILKQCLASLKTPHFIAQVADVVNALQDYSIELATHLGSLCDMLAADAAFADPSTSSAAAIAGSSSVSASHPSSAPPAPASTAASRLVDEAAVKAVVLQSLQVSIIEVLESRDPSFGPDGGGGDGSGGGRGGRGQSSNSAATTSVAQMTFVDVETLLRVCFAFANDIESFFGFAPSTQTRPFRATLQAVARIFFRAQHERQQEKMLTLLQHEGWVPNTQIEGAFQRYCDHIVAASPQAVAAFRGLSVERSTLATPDGTAPRAATGHGASKSNDNAAAAERFEPKLYIPPDECNSNATTTTSGFVAPNSLLMLLQSLHDYDAYHAAFPFLAPDAVMRTHDALKLFDGQCAALVLGAGAVETGALPAITVAHLALAAQCNAFLAELTPLLQRRLRLVTGAGDGSSTSSSSSASSNRIAPFLQHLDRVGRDLTDHEAEFMAKIAAMVKDKVDSSLWLGFTAGGAAGGGGDASAATAGGPPAGAFDPRTWATNRSQWVMSLLKECARIIKHIRPLAERPRDQQGIVVPVISIVVNKINEAIRAVSTDTALFPSLKEPILTDLALLKANVDKFGFDTVQCASVRDVRTALAMVVRPSSDEEFYGFFFG